jgi:glycosyltransferase 2 family protein
MFMKESGIRKWAKRIAVTLLSAGLLYLAVRGVKFCDVWRILRAIRWPYSAAGVLLVVASPLVRAWRWRELYESEAPGFWLLVRAIVAGQTLNFVIPFRTGDVARVFMAGGRKLDTAGAMVFEKLMDAGFFAALCLFLPFFWVVPEWLEGPRVSMIVGSVVFIAAIIIIAAIIPRFWAIPKIVRAPSGKKMPMLVATTLFLGISGVLVNDSILRALQIHAPLIASVVLLIILQVGVAVPSTPGKVGIFQYLAVSGLSLFGVENTQALAFGLVLHLLIFLPPALMALFFFLRDKRYPVGIQNAV